MVIVSPSLEWGQCRRLAVVARFAMALARSVICFTSKAERGGDVMNKKMLTIPIGVGCLVSVLALGTAQPDSLAEFAGHEGSIASVVNLVEAGRHDEAIQLLDLLHRSIVELRASLRGWRLEGEANMLSDPLDLPAGTYRVHFTTEGFGTVTLYDMQGERISGLFNLFAGEASGGASTLFRSSGERMMVEFSNISESYVLVFESLN